MTRRVRTARRRMAQVAIVGALIAAMAALGCSGNRHLSVGGSMHMSSAGYAQSLMYEHEGAPLTASGRGSAGSAGWRSW